MYRIPFKRRGRAQVILGFRNESETFWADLFKDTPVKVHITTDDGSVGTKGFLRNYA